MQKSKVKVVQEKAVKLLSKATKKLTERGTVVADSVGNADVDYMLHKAKVLELATTDPSNTPEDLVDIETELIRAKPVDKTETFNPHKLHSPIEPTHNKKKYTHTFHKESTKAKGVTLMEDLIAMSPSLGREAKFNQETKAGKHNWRSKYGIYGNRRG